MTPFSRLTQIKEIAEGHEPVGAAESWHGLYQQAAIMEGSLALIVEIVKEYETILGMEAT